VAGTTRDIRTANRFAVLRGIYAAGATTRQALTANGNQSFATVSNVVAELLKAEVLVEVSYENPPMGRPRARLAVNADRGQLVGVAISETHLWVEMFDLALRSLAHEFRPLQLDSLTESELVDTVAAAVAAVTAGSGAPSGVPSGVLGVGVSLPGHVARDAEVPLFAAAEPALETPLHDRLTQLLGVPVAVDNPLKAAALAELWFGAGVDARHLVSVTVGTGVGAGIVLHGEVLRGASDSAGEWGHTALVLDGDPCRCGARGCVEAYVGAPAILRRWAAAGGPQTEDELGGIAALAQAVRDGDPTAARVVAETGRYLGAGLANLVNMLNPDTVVLGAFVIDHLEEWLLPAVRAECAARALPRAYESVRLLRSPISGYRTCLGIATFALERFLSDLGVPSRRHYVPVPSNQ
jgi:predicted NBD/HSP70 family sugar kinase